MSPLVGDVQEVQLLSGGDSAPEIHAAAIAAALPVSGLSWLDLGIGRGDAARLLHTQWAPRSIIGVDVIDWLAEDLRSFVDLRVGEALEIVPQLPLVDRVLMIESIEHLDSPWLTLRMAARRVAPGGRIVVSTPNLTTLRHRLELLFRGSLTSFRAADLQHVSPALPHVTTHVLAEEGFIDFQVSYVLPDVISLTGGRHWPRRVAARYPRLLNVSVVVSGRRA